MNSEYFRCRTTTISKVGYYAAKYLYPVVGSVLALSAAFLVIEVTTIESYTVNQLLLLVVTMVISSCLSCFMFYLSRVCAIIETRNISVTTLALGISDKSHRSYTWDKISSIGIIAYAASASKQISQTQVCIFLEPVNDRVLKRLRDSYLYGAINHNSLILLDYKPHIVDTLNMCYPSGVVDLRSRQMQL